MKQIHKHPTDALSLVAGVVFLAAVAWWLFGSAVSVPLPGLGWMVAAALIVFGILGLLGALRGDRRNRESDDDS
jgi:hypothetical protein